VALTRDWGGMSGAPMMMTRAVSSRRVVYRMDLTADARPYLAASRSAVSRLAARITRPAPRRVDDLVVLQRADGSWDLDEALAAVLGKRLKKLQKKLKDATGDPAKAARAWATALALAWLEANAADSRTEWELLAEKAKAWLSRCGAKLAGGEDWLDAASPALTARGFWS